MTSSSGQGGNAAMELRVLRYFIEVARTQNITAAAEHLHITQPTLSKQLMELEEELGKQLFVRGKRKTTLTEDGIFLYRRAQEIVELADKTRTALLSTEETISGDIAFGCGETPGMRLIIDVMKQFNDRYPDVRFHLYSGNDEDVSQKLECGLVDFGLFVGRTDLKPFEYIKLPESDVWGLLMRKDDPLAAHNVISPADLERIPLSCSRQALHSNELSGWLGHDFSRLEIISTHNLVHNAAIMVEAGMGSALTIAGLINTEGTELVFRPLNPPMTAELHFAWKKHRAFSGAGRKFLEFMQTQFRQKISAQ